MSVVLNIYEHILFICIQTKNILILACIEKSSTFFRQDVGCSACRTDAAYAEQEPLWRLNNGFCYFFAGEKVESEEK